MDLKSFDIQTISAKIGLTSGLLELAPSLSFWGFRIVAIFACRFLR
jgi:hypothetical protein